MRHHLKVPPKIVVRGDDHEKAASLIGLAKKRLDDLLTFSDFRGLKVASNNLQLPDGSVITTSLNHGLTTIDISVPSRQGKEAMELPGCFCSRFFAEATVLKTYDLVGDPLEKNADGLYIDEGFRQGGKYFTTELPNEAPRYRHDILICRKDAPPLELPMVPAAGAEYYLPGETVLVGMEVAYNYYLSDYTTDEDINKTMPCFTDLFTYGWYGNLTPEQLVSSLHIVIFPILPGNVDDVRFELVWHGGRPIRTRILVPYNWIVEGKVVDRYIVGISPDNKYTIDSETGEVISHKGGPTDDEYIVKAKIGGFYEESYYEEREIDIRDGYALLSYHTDYGFRRLMARNEPPATPFGFFARSETVCMFMDGTQSTRDHYGAGPVLMFDNDAKLVLGLRWNGNYTPDYGIDQSSADRWFPTWRFFIEAKGEGNFYYKDNDYIGMTPYPFAVKKTLWWDVSEGRVAHLPTREFDGLFIAKTTSWPGTTGDDPHQADIDAFSDNTPEPGADHMWVTPTVELAENYSIYSLFYAVDDDNGLYRYFSTADIKHNLNYPECNSYIRVYEQRVNVDTTFPIQHGDNYPGTYNIYEELHGRDDFNGNCTETSVNLVFTVTLDSEYQSYENNRVQNFEFTQLLKNLTYYNPSMKVLPNSISAGALIFSPFYWMHWERTKEHGAVSSLAMINRGFKVFMICHDSHSCMIKCRDIKDALVPELEAFFMSPLENGPYKDIYGHVGVEIEDVEVNFKAKYSPYNPKEATLELV